MQPLTEIIKEIIQKDKAENLLFEAMCELNSDNSAIREALLKVLEE